MQTMTYLWLGVLIISLIAEAATAALIAVWFVPAALISLILASLGTITIIQVVVFVLISAFCLAFFSVKLRSNLLKKGTKTNLDALIGADAIAEEDFDRERTGRVKIMGQSWSAKTASDRTIVKGEVVRVLKIDGVKLFCEPYEKNASVDEKFIGLDARVEAEIDNYAGTGRIMLEGKSFLAKSVDNELIPKGTIVKIASINGNKYVCSQK